MTEQELNLLKQIQKENKKLKEALKQRGAIFYHKHCVSSTPCENVLHRNEQGICKANSVSASDLAEKENRVFIT